MVYNTFNMIFGVKKLDNKYYGSVISAMDEFLKENGFKADKDGTFKSDTKAMTAYTLLATIPKSNNLWCIPMEI